MTNSFILASASPRRLSLLAQVGLAPSAVVPADVDETPLKAEQPQHYVLRVAQAKAAKVAAMYPGSVILAADTAVVCGTRILPKAETEAGARACLKMLSGRRHRVYTAVVVKNGAQMQSRVVMTQVKCKRLAAQEVEAYIASGEWQGKAGGCAIDGRAAVFIPWISGSFDNVVGLPLYETAQLLKQCGVAV